MKKVLILISILILALMISLVLMFTEKNKVISLDKDIKEYKEKISNLDKEISEFDSKLEEANNEAKSNLNEDKLKVYEIWEKQNKYLDESL